MADLALSCPKWLIHTAFPVIAAAKELGVIVMAYSPLGQGFLTGQVTQKKDLAEDDIRSHMARFQNDVCSY
jgi:aryl-alcohol dehydrogenase-like predicted oxidoreductase